MHAKPIVDNSGQGPRIKPVYELLNHTDSIVIHSVAPTIAELVHPCTVGLYAVCGELTTIAATTERRTFEASGEHPAAIIRNYLVEILSLLESEQLVVVAEDSVELTLEEPTGDRLVVTALLEKLDPGASIPTRKVKTIAGQDLVLQPVNGGFEINVVVNI